MLGLWGKGLGSRQSLPAATTMHFLGAPGEDCVVPSQFIQQHMAVGTWEDPWLSLAGLGHLPEQCPCQAWECSAQQPALGWHCHSALLVVT